MRDVDELVVTAAAANWPRLALRLGVKSGVSKVVLKAYPNDCEMACWDMLNRWLRGECHTGEEERTWSTLLTGRIYVFVMDLNPSQLLLPPLYHNQS